MAEGREARITLRVPAEMVDALERAAEAADRSLSAEVRRAIKQYLAGRATQGRE